MDRAHQRSVHWCFQFAYFSSFAALAAAGLTLVSWLANSGFVRSIVPPYAAIRPNTAVAFLLTAISLGLSGAWRRSPVSSSPRIAKACAVIIAVIGLITLGEFIFPIGHGIDVILFPRALQMISGPYPGRMAPTTAAGFVCLGLALFLLDSKSWIVHRISQGCALAAFFIGLLSTVGYLYGAESLYRISEYESTGFNTSLLFVLLSASVLCVRPRNGVISAATSGHLGGLAVRRILPVAMAAPLLFGGLCVAGYRAGLYTNEFGVALFATANIVLFSVIVRASADQLNTVDAQNQASANIVQQSGLDLKAAHQELFLSEERFRLFMEYLPAAAFLKDGDGRYIWGNSAWRRQFPEEWGDIYGKKDKDLWSPEVHDVFAASDIRVLSENIPVQLVESGKAGKETRHWLVSKFPVQDSDGARLIGGVSFDTTDRKELEQQLFQSQKLEAVGLLAGGVAHDFNNLLTVILGFVEEVKLDFKEGRSPLDDLEEIMQAAQRAAALTSQLLAFGRKQVLQPRLLNLNEVLVEHQRLLRRVLRENIKLELALGPDVGKVLVDPTQIHQVVMNLAMNAQDAMPDGGRLILETSNVDLEDSYVVSQRQVNPGPYVQLAISDTGMGMDQATREHIFEPFFTTKVVGKGTGLGLATVYGVVKQSSGYIWVYSEPGQGTSFKIYLPRVDTAQLVDEELAPRVEANGAGAAGQTILIAEDEDAVRLLMVKACTKAGYHLLAATSGEEALVLSESHDGLIHLLVTDVIMQGMNGRALAEQIHKHRSEIRVLYCSGYSQNVIMDQGVLGPNAAFLQKPYTAKALLKAIQKVLA